MNFSKVANHDIGGFDIKMENAFGVRIIDGIAEVEKNMEKLREV